MNTMAIRINPGNLQSSDALVAWTERKVRTSLRRFASRITRVEVHFADINGPREGKTDLRCAMEVRINGRKPLAVEHRAEDLYTAIDGAARRLRTAVNRAVDRVNSRAHRIAQRRTRGAALPATRATSTQGPARALVPDMFDAARTLHLSEALQARQVGTDAVTGGELATADAMATSVADALAFRVRDKLPRS